MGRADGTGRLVSQPGADDSGTRILHVDMDAFYASVAVLDDPSLRGKPLIIGAPEGRSVVSSASYEARRFGVRSAMPVSQALRLCPQAITVTPRFERYVEVSRQVFDVFRSITPLVEPLSIDEAFLDVSGARRLWGSPGHIATMLRARILSEVGIVCSVGVAATKHVAKMASTMSKPDGLLIVPQSRTLEFLEPRSVRALWGVGPKAAEALEGRGIHTVADVIRTPHAVLVRALGPSMAGRIGDLARGIDPRAVETGRVEKSVGHEETFHVDIADHGVLRSELRRLADRVGARLRSNEWTAGSVSIKIRYADFTTLTRTVTLPAPTSVGQRIGEAAIGLFDALELRQSVRLVGVRAEKLQPAAGSVLGLWDDDEEWRNLEGAVDEVAARFGKGALTRATLLGARRDVAALPTDPRTDRMP
ncbi:DNA polymerase IV [Microbacterium mangrovi]|uniref:DNA polymerase IV n=1 Tax=Microbacterium mangrovi TaxID=1348253 RepID=A0A0B2A7K3_9MICO|nr:DNA polymerase IV [Microbacterium mangrovi]KHK97527.1 DNA polymerase IV [Microbacterium mangrovi]